MIDPLGPDSGNFVPQRAQAGPDVEVIAPPLQAGPKVRHANYDDPAASQRVDNDPRSASGTRLTPAPRPNSARNALTRPAPHKPTAFERALTVAKTVLPYVGKMLPLLEGNVVSAATNLLANRPMQELDLKPLEESIARLQTDQRALAFHTTDQKRAIQRLEDELAAVQEAVQQNSAQQAELIEQVARLAKRTSSFMRLVTVLLVASILFTALICIRIAYIIRF